MSEKVDALEAKIMEEAKKKLDAGGDKGHTHLIEDLETILTEAKAFEFHDFLNENYALPKNQLRAYLQRMMEKVEHGDYDN